ncbi:hypothetical protein [Bacillus sp. FJAT-27445]|uniref:hypothetical protein n=1 Tax=Bacillus sp. FJAT-27445 TaxID=1679166 RepID=UPI0012E3F61A|nr:hypothetical protein [Bacillus sp. FJAT-27445]
MSDKTFTTSYLLYIKNNIPFRNRDVILDIQTWLTFNKISLPHGPFSLKGSIFKQLLSVSAHAFRGHGFSLLVAKDALLWGLQLALFPQEKSLRRTAFATKRSFESTSLLFGACTTSNGKYYK